MTENNEKLSSSKIHWIKKNRTFVILIGIVITIVLLAVLYYLLIIKQNKDVLTYENSRYGFKVDYPDDWRLGQEPTNSDGREISSPDDQVICRAYGFNNSLPNDSGQPQTTNQYVEWIIETEKQTAENTGFNLIDKSQSKLGGEEAMRLVFESDGKISDLIYSLNTEIGLGLSCEYDSSGQRQKYQNDFDLMLESFEIK